jgi:Zn-dependent M28 family amino/carboxypeptidase
VNKYELLGQVSRGNLERDVKELATRWPTRHTLSKHHPAIVAHLEKRFQTLGYTPKRHAYLHSGKTLHNVLAEKPSGSGGAILVCAHFDSRQEDIAAPEALAPGANDNATGVAVVFEVARLLKNTPLRHPVRFALFSGEEQDLWGSTAYASECKKRGEKLTLVFNLDEVGYPDTAKSLFLDRDEGGVPGNNAASAKLVARLEVLAKTIVKVPTKIDPVEASDYVPFEQHGYIVTGLYEGEYRYPHYHKSTDTPDKVDFGYVTNMAKLTLAFLLDYTK